MERLLLPRDLEWLECSRLGIRSVRLLPPRGLELQNCYRLGVLRGIIAPASVFEVTRLLSSRILSGKIAMPRDLEWWVPAGFSHTRSLLLALDASVTA